MQFVYPAFLFALASLAIPVLVHLFNFRKYQKVYFSNVQFLKEVNEQQSSRRNLKERLILAARLLALAFLVLAFARPFIPGKNSITAGKQQAVSIFIDNSYSMQTLTREGSLLDEAKRRAKEIASAYNINDRFQLLTQDFEGRHQRLLSREEFNNAVDTVKISAQSRSLPQIINRQQSLLQGQNAAIPSAYIISDFQKSAYSQTAAKQAEGMQVNMVQLKANTLPNVAVDSVWLLNALHRPNETERLVVKLHNYAAEDAQGIPLKLMVNGTQKALGSFTVKARSISLDTLTFSGLQAGWQQAEIQLQDNPVTFDNQFYFTFKVRKQMPVLLVDGGTPNVYLNAAFRADAFFNVNGINDGNVNYSTLGTYPLVVLSDVKSISTGLAQQLKSYVAKGGTLLVFPAADADLASYRTLLQPVGAAWPEKLVAEETRVASLNLQNPLFKTVFEDVPQNPDLPKVHKYYTLAAATRSSTQSLMELPGHQPFWAGYNSGSGHIYVAAVALDDAYSNLQRHALMLPVLFRIALLSGHDQPLFYTIGQDNAIETEPIQLSEKQIIKLQKGTLSFIPDVRRQEGSTLLYVADQIQQPGNYRVARQDSTIAITAFNNSRHESDLTYLNNADLSKLSPKGSAVIQAGNGSLKGAVAETNFGLQLWKLCIILALIFVAAEIALVRFFRVNKSQVSGLV
ncbi:BatA domain-containing protein [Mucilaginibacter sp. Bleaf8]|uniref:BatA domain-containing protein n=1 Tax=Mucilaginibacter sp. Bleaf8 TaxID=2834430 RepID=UPI001BCF0D62|nr:BatA domain-containing protein [Mucilaginibacter sp. Bleaf8]MBS7563768.1 BatA domain-containing protein [Mucilaginibacter sp. Bleaf8]